MSVKKNLIIIDFEAVNNNDACEVGAIKIVNEKIVDSFSSIIKPHSPIRNPRSISVHNINESDWENSPSFSDLFSPNSKLFDWINNPENIVVCHGAGFDISQVLKGSLKKFPFKYNFNYICSWKTLENLLGKKIKGYYKLEELAKKHKINYKKHRALDDSIALHEVIKKEFGNYSNFLSFAKNQKNGIKTFQN